MEYWLLRSSTVCLIITKLWVTFYLVKNYLSSYYYSWERGVSACARYFEHLRLAAAKISDFLLWRSWLEGRPLGCLGTKGIFTISTTLNRYSKSLNGSKFWIRSYCDRHFRGEKHSPKNRPSIFANTFLAATISCRHGFLFIFDCNWVT